MFGIFNLTSEKGSIFLKQAIIRHGQTSLYKYTERALLSREGEFYSNFHMSAFLLSFVSTIVSNAQTRAVVFRVGPPKTQQTSGPGGTIEFHLASTIQVPAPRVVLGTRSTFRSLSERRQARRPVTLLFGKAGPA